MKLFGGPRYPEEVAARVPPGQRLVKGWPVLHYGPIPRFDEATWDFKVFGEVESPYELSYAQLKAWANRGEPLAPEHGYPLRLVVPKRYAWKSTKWVRGVEFSASNDRGFWEVRGYHNHADPWREERYSYQESRESATEP